MVTYIENIPIQSHLKKKLRSVRMVFNIFLERQPVRCGMSIERLEGKTEVGSWWKESVWHQMPRLIQIQTCHSTCLEGKPKWGLISPVILSKAADGWPSKQQPLILWPLVLSSYSMHLSDYVKSDVLKQRYCNIAQSNINTHMHMSRNR